MPAEERRVGVAASLPQLGKTVSLERVGVAAVMLLLLGSTAGCHKRAQVSQRSTPPPPPARRSSGTTTAHRTPPPVPIPNTNAGDNVPNGGRVSSMEVGMASWYAPNGRRSANGDVYDGQAMTAAHRTLPMGTVIRVTNLTTGVAATVTVTDRGPFVRGRVLDLSTAAAKATGVYRMGVAQVRIEVVQQRADVSPAGKWCVQVGAFSEEEDAASLKADLLRRYSAVAKVTEFPGATGYWVRLNPVNGDRARATAIVQSLRPSEAAAQAWLVRLD